VIAPAPAKINLALVVGPQRDDGMHQVATVLQRLDLGDRLKVEPARETTVEGFAGDTIVRAALDALSAPHGWRVRIEKNVPVAAGLGGGSSDAATALRLANAQLAEPYPPERLHELAAQLGADVPFFLYDGPQLATGDGTTLEPVDVPQDFAVLLLLPRDAAKPSTASVYAAFDARATSRRSRRTTSPARRTPRPCAPSAPFARTSPGPARPSTASSTTAATRAARAAP